MDQLKVSQVQRFVKCCEQNNHDFYLYVQVLLIFYGKLTFLLRFTNSRKCCSIDSGHQSP